MFVATAVIASEAPVVTSFFERSRYKSWLCSLPQMGTLQVLLLQSFNRWPGLRQLNHSQNFCLCSLRSFSFIDLSFSQHQMACCPSLKGHFESLGLVELSELNAEVLVFGFSRLCDLRFLWASKFSCMKAVDSNQSLTTVKFAASSRWSSRWRRHCSFSWYRMSQAWLYACELKSNPEMAAFAWLVSLILRKCIFSVSLSRSWSTMTSKSTAYSGRSKGSPEDYVSLSFGSPLGSPIAWLFTCGVVGSLLFGFGVPSICCESCAWVSDFSACLWPLTDGLCCWNVVMGNNICGSVTLIDLGISGFLRVLESCSCVWEKSFTRLEQRNSFLVGAGTFVTSVFLDILRRVNHDIWR